MSAGQSDVASAGQIARTGFQESSRLSPLGWWLPERTISANDTASLRSLIGDLRQPVIAIRTASGIEAAIGGTGSYAAPTNGSGGTPIVAVLPAFLLSRLGDPGFRTDYGLRYAYLAGAMANGIASESIVEAMAKAGMLGFFGAAGLSLERVSAAIDRLQGSLRDLPHGFNLIHSPNESDHEAAVADLYIRRGVKLVEASAYLRLTPAIVRYRLHGILKLPDGRIHTPNRVIAKVSRIEVATRFFSPAPESILRELVELGQLTAEQAELAKHVPIAQDITAEADSGGHTDNRPAITLLPTLLACRDRMQVEHRYDIPLRVGLGGGIATPAGVAAAFAMGAAFVLTGSINQACVESGSSDLVRGMLAEAEQADVAMAPAADMFEMGVKVQVLKRGTMFAMRAGKLYELYRSSPSLEELPAAERSALEKNYFRASLDEIWRDTKSYFLKRDPKQVERAEAEPKHRMALVFRWYLGQSSRWANAGVADRKVDFQVWCGPAMGAFNEWTRGSFLQEASRRRVADVAMSLLYGAAVLSRQAQLKAQGVDWPREAFPTEPIEPASIAQVTRDDE